MNHIDERTNLVRALIQGERPVGDLLSELDLFAWDSDELVILTRSDVVRILRRYVDGLSSADDVEEWANGIELRDDVGVEPDHERLLRDVIFHLANPDVNEPITPEFAQRWIERMERASE
jgi:hypothetical protein